MSSVTYETKSQLVQQGGTVYFALLFVIGLIFALRPSKKATYQRAAHIPLEEDHDDVPA